MRLFDFLFPERRSSASVAKERLKIVLAHERASRDAPDFLPALQKELLDVVARYVEIRGDIIRVAVDKTGETSTLEINVEIAGAKPRPVAAAAAAAAAPPPRATAPMPVVKPPSAEEAEAGWPFAPAPNKASAATAPAPASGKRRRPS